MEKYCTFTSGHPTDLATKLFIGEDRSACSMESPELVELYVSMAVSIRQQFFHLNSRTEIAHVSSPLVENFNLRHKNTVHWSVVGEA